ncbi:MAG: uracil-DNA glycosylase [Deltaproteobacteria bacterium]|nr:uracil-DNA glycosylase [Deltaproteobacteria bacterium]
MEQISTLESLQVQYRACPRCALARTRNRLVFGVGHEAARLLFIGEGPGADEDSQGLPFVGRAGRLLTGFISALGLTRDDVYITNVVKCRPPENRNPEPDETASCMPILKKQIELINPRIIVTLGNVPLRALQPDAPGITKARGIPLQLDGRTILPTYHPSYLLRNPAGIPDCWRDFRKALEMAYGS